MATTIKPVLEPCPSLPEPKKSRKNKPNWKPHQLFGFDTETTRCGLKEIRSSQFAYYIHNWKEHYMVIDILALKGWFPESPEVAKNRVEGYTGETVVFNFQEFDTVEELREASQLHYEKMLYEGQVRVKRNKKGEMKNVSRKIKRCAVAFNANFDLGVLSDKTIFDDEMNMGGMVGAGVEYRFNSSYRKYEDYETGLRIKALYLGAKSMPYVSKRGECWDIQPLARELWNAGNLATVGMTLGLPKLTDEGETSLTYGAMDAVITLKASIELTKNLEDMGFTGNADRFISGATVSKDMMKRHYTPFYLSQSQHEFAWKAYYGGMTGALDIMTIRKPLSNLIYGDLDGAYNASGQKLEVFKWCDAEWLSAYECELILKKLEEDPSLFWKYGSLHIEVEGDFDNVPLRVGVCGENSQPTKSQGLIWSKVTNYRTVMALGDFLHSRPSRLNIIKGLMASSKRNENPCLFKMCDVERKKFPKKIDGVTIIKNLVPNTWWKLAGNCLYGSFANRNGKDRTDSGKWFNGLVASSITGAIRHCMWIVNESSDAYYNDTDSGLTTVEGFEKAVKALEHLDIGFSNKTSDELPDCDVALVGVVQGSKRYALKSECGKFGAKCHGLGMWYILKDGKAKSVAHDEEILEAVWQFNYPHLFGEADETILQSKVFRKFSIKSRTVSNIIKEYCRRQWELPLLEVEKHGKAGNFGFLSPTMPIKGSSKMIVKASFDVESASNLSDFKLEHIALMWGMANDKKFDYKNLKRWEFDGRNMPTVEAFDLLVNDGNASNLITDVDRSLR